MIRMPGYRVEQLISEDVPYIDLTTMVMGIGDRLGEMVYFTREDCVLAGMFVVRKIMSKLGLKVVEAAEDGARLSAGQTFLKVEGACEDLHVANKVCLNLFDHLSAVATKTRGMVDAAHEVSPHCEILTTRKSMPGVKDLHLHAVLIGGAYPHRLGLSETVLVFENHLEFYGGFDKFLHDLPEIRKSCIEKKVFVEANPEQALALAHAGVDGIQFDKVPVDQLKGLVREIRAIDPHVTLIAAGGVKPDNVREYAATGVDGVATTAPFTAAPIDMSAKMHAL